MTIISFLFLFLSFLYSWAVEEAAGIAHSAIFENHGQNCCAGSRTYVQAGIYDAFVARAKALAAERKVGDPFGAGTQQGPQVDKDMIDKITDLVESGKKEGAVLQTGGERFGTVGFFFKVRARNDSSDTDLRAVLQRDYLFSSRPYSQT